MYKVVKGKKKILCSNFHKRKRKFSWDIDETEEISYEKQRTMARASTAIFKGKVIHYSCRKLRYRIHHASFLYNVK